ncbi:probable disease resistance RPP8-like protein 2 [Coffea arabica]|uniref:Probable disease resistance RPP8-like protein 2 n=1 Tax=Coffea arabica TaxID=13443 RepID=A0ABM4UQV4_COFAR
MANFPKYDAQYMYASLVDMTLTEIEIEEDPMKTLERLPNQRSLLLAYESFLGKEMRCKATGFGQLRFFRLFGLTNLVKWIVDEGAMPNLSVLMINCCPKLEIVPNGLRYIKTLKELIVVSMPERFTNRIQAVNGADQRQDFDKVSHIPSIIVNGCRTHLTPDILRILIISSVLQSIRSIKMGDLDGFRLGKMNNEYK